jgi:hypothetical protein
MLRVNLMPSANDAALQQAKSGLDAIGRDVAANVDSGKSDRAVTGIPLIANCEN